MIDAQIAQRKAQIQGQIKALQAQPTADAKTQEKIKALAAQATNISANLQQEADVIWVYDMMKELGISQHNMCSCSVTAAGDMLFVNTSNGVDEGHNYIPAARRAELRRDGQEHRQGALDRQFARPEHSARPMVVARVCACSTGVPQVIFGGGDGWLYSFDACR